MYAVDQLMGTGKYRRRKIHNLFQQRSNNPMATEATTITKTAKKRGGAGVRSSGGS